MALLGTLPRPSLGPPWTSLYPAWAFLGPSSQFIGSSWGFLVSLKNSLKQRVWSTWPSQGPSSDPRVTPDVPQMPPSRPQMTAWIRKSQSRDPKNAKWRSGVIFGSLLCDVWLLFYIHSRAPYLYFASLAAVRGISGSERFTFNHLPCAGVSYASVRS